jgi:hypothetical protein
VVAAFRLDNGAVVEVAAAGEHRDNLPGPFTVQGAAPLTVASSGAASA